MNNNVVQLDFLGEDECLRSTGLSTAEQAVMDKAFEIIKKRFKPGTKLTSPESVRNMLQVELSLKSYEVFGVIWLDNQHKIIGKEILFEGCIDACHVYPRHIVERAIHHMASAVIIYHNHPSGNATESTADRSITTKIKTALDTIDVRVLDHMIVGGFGTLSVAEKGYL